MAKTRSCTSAAATTPPPRSRLLPTGRGQGPGPGLGWSQGRVPGPGPGPGPGGGRGQGPGWGLGGPWSLAVGLSFIRLTECSSGFSGCGTFTHIHTREQTHQRGPHKYGRALAGCGCEDRVADRRKRQFSFMETNTQM